MSEFGSDSNPSKPAAQDLAYTKAFMPLGEVWFYQWSYDDQQVVRLMTNRKSGVRCGFKIQE